MLLHHLSDNDSFHFSRHLPSARPGPPLRGRPSPNPCPRPLGKSASEETKQALNANLRTRGHRWQPSPRPWPPSLSSWCKAPGSRESLLLSPCQWDATKRETVSAEARPCQASTFRRLLLLEDLAGPRGGAFGHVDDVLPLHLSSHPASLGGNTQALLLPVGQGSWGRGCGECLLGWNILPGERLDALQRALTCPLSPSVRKTGIPYFSTTPITMDSEPPKNSEAWARWGTEGTPRLQWFSVALSLPQAGPSPSPARLPWDIGWVGRL